MKKHYSTPQIEVVEIEIEEAVLATSGTTSNSTTTENYAPGTHWGDPF